ncbi:hypothetical protein AX17_006493 [Amanita inopinata Kibby_2008]|nr:hypothetical protein AX17_006493 [Amanita inopinata Kibby_2008]
MPEYVYALHDFVPENEDEIPFRAGDRIEVIEKDDLYGDGWWQGRNLEGNVGLFPQSYTAPAPPMESMTSSSSQTTIIQGTGIDGLNKSVLHPLDEESETESPPEPATIHAPIPKTPAVFQNGNSVQGERKHEGSDSQQHHRRIGSDGEVMKATMTDVQQAIEQLGRGHDVAEDGDGSRSFSFASSREDRDTEVETDTDLDVDTDGAADRGQGWHNSARRKLAEKAKRAVEEAEKLEAIMSNSERNNRSTAPPIDVEVSDESEGEEDLNGFANHKESYRRRHPHIPEEDEDADQNEYGTSDSVQTSVNGTAKDDSFAIVTAHSSTVTTVSADAEKMEKATISSLRSSLPPALETSTVQVTDGTDVTRSVHTPSSSRRISSENKPLEVSQEPRKRTSSPLSFREPVQPTSLDRVVRAVSPQPQSLVTLNAPSMTASAGVPVPPATQPGEKEKDKERPDPSEWSVEEVVEWLESKGFDQDVQNKFIEQEITGDVLLELDANILKTEIGIMAFGKRVRIANAIAELRRPTSPSPLGYSQQLPQGNGLAFQPSPEMLHQPFPGAFPSSTPPHLLPTSHSHSPISSHFYPQGLPSVHQMHTHSRTQSQGQHSQRSFPASTTGVAQPVVYTQSLNMQGPLPSPLGYAPGFGAIVAGNGNGMGVGVNGANGITNGYASAPESMAGANGNASSVETSASVKEKAATRDQNGSLLKPRPTQLSLSPSDGALSESIKAVNENGEEEDEDRGHLSESEVVTDGKKARRRLFGRSHDSSISRVNSSSRLSKVSSLQASLSTKDTSDEKEKEKDDDKSKETFIFTSRQYVRGKKSVDAGKSTADRLSIFGAAFTGSLGKSRKPPPRYSVDDNVTEKSSLFPLPRLSSSGISRKVSTARPSTSNGSPKWLRDMSSSSVKEDEKKEVKEPTVLRKRTNSNPGQANVPSSREESPVVGTNGAVAPLKQGQNILEQIGEMDHSGWMRKKGDRYNSWKMRYFVLSGPHLYCLRSNSKTETKIKGYINIVGYKVTVDETVDPGKYGFRIDHETDKTHYFSSDEKTVIREWMKAIMKATIGRDYTKPVISSCNIPTIPLTVAQAMNPAPRPPSPSARAATQKAHRTKDLETLGVKDISEVSDHATLVLMGLGPRNGSRTSEERSRVDSVFPGAEKSMKEIDGDSAPTPRAAKIPIAPPRPAREVRRQSRRASIQLELSVIEWANSHLPANLQVTDLYGPTYSALALFRLAESIRGYPASPPVPDSAFPTGPHDEKSIDGLFNLFDLMVVNDVKMGSVSINDIKLGRVDKVAQIVKALKLWEDKRRVLDQSWGRSAVTAQAQAGAFMAMNAPVSLA